MKIRLRLITMVSCFLLMLSPLKVHAIVTNPIMMADPVRSVVGILMTLFYKGDDPIMGATLNVTQEEVAALLAGDESYVEDEGTGEAGPGLSTPTYDYINSNVLTSSAKTPYGPLNSKLGSGDMKAAVKEMFFIADAKSATEEKQAEVLARRTAYLTRVGKYYVQLAYEVQQKLISDMESISADINGNGSIGATAGMDQTWHAINRALIADIALQIQLMELDAAKFLSVQPLILMSETPPETEGSGTTPAEGDTETPLIDPRVPGLNGEDK